MREWEDLDLVSSVRTGEEAELAFAILVERHREYIQATCRFLVGSEVDIEDLAQEVLTKAYFALESFEGRAAFRTWLRRIAVNHCLNYLKKNRKQAFVNVEDPTLASCPELQRDPNSVRELEATMSRERIGWALESMPETLRSALVLREWKGMSYQEIADELDLGLSAVKMRIKRARSAFQESWERSERPSFQTLGRLRKIEDVSAPTRSDEARPDLLSLVS